MDPSSTAIRPQYLERVEDDARLWGMPRASRVVEVFSHYLSPITPKTVRLANKRGIKHAGGPVSVTMPPAPRHLLISRWRLSDENQLSEPSIRAWCGRIKNNAGTGEDNRLNPQSALTCRALIGCSNIQ